jgi:multiple sugar transport system substrate-binding protein
MTFRRLLPKDRRSRRVVLAAGLAGAGAGAVGACIPQAQEQGGGDRGGAPKPVTLVFNHRTGQPQGDLFKSHFNARFQEQFPHITVDHTVIPSGEWQEKFIVLYSSDTPGDLIWSNQADQMHLFSAAGMHKVLDDLVKRDRYDLGQFYAKTIEDNRWEGKLYGLPWQSHAGLSGLYVNADLARQHGVALPASGARWTNEQFAEAARKLTREADGIWGTFVDTPAQLWQNAAYSYGATVLSADGTKHALTDPRLIAALEWMADLIRRQRVAPATQERSGSHSVNLAQKKVAMVTAGAWEIPTIDRAVQGAFPWAVLPVPEGPAGAWSGYSANDNWSIPAISKNPDAAWTYAKWFCEDQQLGDWLRLWGGNPTAKPKLNGTQYVSGEYAAYRKAHLDQLQSGKYRVSPTPKNQRQSELINQLLQPKLAQVWRGEKPVRAALQELEAPVSALLGESLAVTR